MQYRPLKITYSFFHCQSNIINNDNGLPLSWICFSFLQPNILHIPSTPFWSITHSEQTICYSMTQIPQTQISQGRQARSKKKYIFKLWDKPLSHSDSKLCIQFWFILNQIPYEQSVIRLYWFFPLSCNLFLLFFSPCSLLNMLICLLLWKHKNQHTIHKQKLTKLFLDLISS